MANNKLYIVEFRNMARDEINAPVIAAETPANAVQNVDIGAGSVASAAFATGTRFIQVAADSDCCIRINGDPTAVQGDWKLFAGVIVYYGVKPGDKIAVIEEAP